jgi:hypothetical protein
MDAALSENALEEPKDAKIGEDDGSADSVDPEGVLRVIGAVRAAASALFATPIASFEARPEEEQESAAVAGKKSGLRVDNSTIPQRAQHRDELTDRFDALRRSLSLSKGAPVAAEAGAEAPVDDLLRRLRELTATMEGDGTTIEEALDPKRQWYRAQELCGKADVGVVLADILNCAAAACDARPSLTSPPPSPLVGTAAGAASPSQGQLGPSPLSQIELVAVHEATLCALWKMSRLDKNVDGMVGVLPPLVDALALPSARMLRTNELPCGAEESAELLREVRHRIRSHAMKVVHNMAFQESVAKILADDVALALVELLAPHNCRSFVPDGGSCKACAFQDPLLAATAVQSIAGHGAHDARKLCHPTVECFLKLAAVRRKEDLLSDKSAPLGGWSAADDAEKEENALEEIWEKCCAALRNIAVAPESQVFLMKQGAVDVLLPLLEIPGNHRDEAINALRNIASDSVNQEKMTKPDVLEALLHILGAADATDGEKAGCVAAFRNLSVAERSRIEIAKRGAVELVVPLIVSGTEEQRLQGCAFLRNMSVPRNTLDDANPEPDSLLIQPLVPAINALAMAMADDSTSKKDESAYDAKRHAAFALWNAARFPEPELAVIRCGQFETACTTVGESPALAKRKDGSRELHEAVKTDAPEVSTLLLQHSVYLAMEFGDDNGTLLHTAATARSRSAIMTLARDIRFDWMLKTRDKKGRLPVDCVEVDGTTDDAADEEFALALKSFLSCSPATRGRCLVFCAQELGKRPAAIGATLGSLPLEVVLRDIVPLFSGAEPWCPPSLLPPRSLAVFVEEDIDEISSTRDDDDDDEDEESEGSEES